MQLRKNPSVEKKSQEDKPNSTVNTLAALLSSTVGLLVFHPADTLVKRLQNKNTKVDPGKVDSLKKATLSSFYKGFLSASALSAAHKVIKYAGEPVVKELLHQHAPQKKPGDGACHQWFFDWRV